MKIKGLVDEDITNFKTTSMFIITSSCSFKCDRENQANLCQNSHLADAPIIEMNIETIYQRYLSNPLSHSIVVGGLEPFDTLDDLVELLTCFRIKHKCKDPIVIYTGYTESELNNILIDIHKYSPLIIKYGRYRPGQEPHLDPILGVELQNDEQYAVAYT